MGDTLDGNSKMPAFDPPPSTAAGPHGSSRKVLSRLLVGYDGSAGAGAAVSFALALAGKARCSVTLVHVVPDGEAAASAELVPGVAQQIVEQVATWQHRLENLAAYAAPGVAVTCRAVPGAPAAVLSAIASEFEADVILVGSRGLGPVRRALMGSVSTELLAHAPCSVMVFPGESTPPARAHVCSVIAGIDGSPASLRALTFAQALARPLEATLVLVHVYDAQACEPGEAALAELRRRNAALVHAARGVVSGLPSGIAEEIVAGLRGPELLAACERHAPALLVVGSRRAGRLESLMVGSTSRWAVNHARCPVLVVPMSHEGGAMRHPTHAEAPLESVRAGLDAAGISYEIVEHAASYTAADEARAAGQERSETAKTLVLIDHGEPRLAVVPAARRLDLARARHVLRADRHLRLATEEEAAQAFPEYEVGALPPFAGGRAPEIVDTRLLYLDRVLCAAGDHRHGVLLAPRDLVRMAEPRVADICVHAPGEHRFADVPHV